MQGGDLMLEITQLAKSSGPLTKSIRLSETGQMVTNGSACLMTVGTAQRMRLGGMHDFANAIHRMQNHQAIALGALDPALPDLVNVTTRKRLEELNGRAGPNTIARTGGHISYRRGEPGLVLLDHDSKGMPSAVANRIGQLGGFWAAIVSILPELANVARVERTSTSSGIIRSDTGAAMPGSDGVHVYLLIKDGSDTERFLRTLHARAWLAGLGWMMVGAGGQLLNRSIVDAMVYAAERLVFEGPPRLAPPLQQDYSKRVPTVSDGKPADTVAVCRNLTPVETANLKALHAAEKLRLKPDVDKAWADFVTLQAERIAKRTGLSPGAARRIADRQCDGILLPHVVLPFDAEEFSGCTAADVLADPDRFIGATLADPMEGPDYGACKAQIMRRGDGAIWIHSFAHGRTTYHLRYDAASIEVALRAVDKADLVDTFLRLILLADLTPSDEQALKALATDLGGIKLRPLNAQIKAAREDQQKRLADDARTERAIARTDKRFQLPAPPPDAERTPVLQTLDEVLCGVGGMQPPMRNIEGWPIEIRCRPPSKLHELTSGGANNDEEETSRLPAPSLPLITEHDKYSLAHEIERHIEFFAEDKDGNTRPVALAPVFVEHFAHWRDSAMPRVEAIVTAPLVLPDGTLLAPEGLDRERRLFFRIEPELREMLPTQVSRADVADAMDFLCNAWLCDVATDFKGKCILVSCALSIIERVLLPQRPIFVVSAGKRGGGKTTVIRLLCLAVTGKTPPAAAWSASEEERRKAILGYLSEGLPCLVWDNLPVGASISCPTIDKVSTSASYSDRVLKQTDNRTVPTYTIMIFTGNNVTPCGETASRSLRARLEVDRPDPENRVFTHPDPDAWTLNHRGEILRALYTILLGNQQLHPAHAKEAKTRFKEWWRLVGSAVENAATALAEAQTDKTPDSQKAAPIDFGAIVAEIEAEDEETGSLGELLGYFHARWKGAFQAADITQHIGDIALSSLQEHIEERKALCAFFDPTGRRGTDISAVTIGKRLKKILGAPVWVGDHTMTLKPISAAGKRTTFYQAHVAAR